MTMMKAAIAAGSALALAMLVSTALVAQQAAPTPPAPPVAPDTSAPPTGPGMRGPGMRGPAIIGPGMMGPGMHHGKGPGGFGMVCNERLAQSAQMRLDRIERAVAPTDTQRAGFDVFKAASTRAMEMVRAACPSQPPLTPTGKLEAQEKLLDARLQAVRLVRAALDPFYKSLTDEQKARFNAATSPRPSRWGESFRDRNDDQGRNWRGPNWRDQNRTERFGQNWGDRDRQGDWRRRDHEAHRFGDRDGRGPDRKSWREQNWQDPARPLAPDEERL